MYTRTFIHTFVSSMIVTILLLGSLLVSHAQTMTSSNFKIQHDSINVGGGYSSSTNYITRSTVGEISTGQSDSASYKLRAGYQQMDEVYIAITSATDVTMDASIGGLSGGTAHGSTSVTVTTDSAAGYQLTINSATSPAMQSPTDTISDYSPVGAAPDVVLLTGASDAHFAYSPWGTDVAQRFQTNGTVCDVAGTASTTACWDGLSIAPETVAASVSSNHPLGTETSIYFQVEIGGAAAQPAGLYVATTTITALPL